MSIIISYYENPEMLRLQYKNFREMPESVRESISLIVVDDGSPDEPAEPADLGFDLSIYRMQVDVRWNQDACKNLGVHVSHTEWVILTDVDHLIPASTLSHISQAKLDRDTIYTFERLSADDCSPIKPHPNSWLMTRSMYDLIGGYDERFAGFYAGCDLDFGERAHAVAKAVVRLPVPLIVVQPNMIADAATRRYKRNEPRDIEARERILTEREAICDWRPLTLSFPWEKVYPTGPV